MSDRHAHIPLPTEGCVEAIQQASDTVFNWATNPPDPLPLYEKGKRLQWNATTTSTVIDVDPEKFPDFSRGGGERALNPPVAWR